MRFRISGRALRSRMHASGLYEEPGCYLGESRRPATRSVQWMRLWACFAAPVLVATVFTGSAAAIALAKASSGTAGCGLVVAGRSDEFVTAKQVAAIGAKFGGVNISGAKEVVKRLQAAHDATGRNNALAFAFNWCSRTSNGTKPPGPPPEISDGLIVGDVSVPVSRFSPSFTVTGVDGWFSRSDCAPIALGFTVERPTFDAPASAEVEFLVYQGDATSAATVVAAIPAQSAAPVAGRVGNHAAIRVDLVAPPGQSVLVVDQYSACGGAEYLLSGARGRAYVLEVAGKIVVIVITAPAADFDAFDAKAEKLLGGVQF